MVKRGNKIGIYLCKRTKVKITDMAYLRLLRVRTGQCKYRKLAITPEGNPKRGNKKGNNIDMYLCKKSKAKTRVISYLRAPEYGMTNGSNLRVAFTPDSTPKRGKKGVTQESYMCLCKTCQS